MKAKYIKEKLDGTFAYPDCPETIKSKEDLQRWFENTSQQFADDVIDDKGNLLAHVPTNYIKEQTDSKIVIMFPRCRHTASVLFAGNECYRISL